MEVAILFGSFALLLILRVPSGISLGMSSLIAIFSSGVVQPTYLAQGLVTGADSFPLMAVPFFVLAGELMATGGISRRLLNIADAFLGRKYGGLALVTVVACMFFAAISGSGPATVAAIGGLTIPSMLKQGYDKNFASAITAAAGSIGVIIPPSITFVVYGSIADTSIGDLNVLTYTEKRNYIGIIKIELQVFFYVNPATLSIEKTYSYDSLGIASGQQIADFAAGEKTTAEHKIFMLFNSPLNAAVYNYSPTAMTMTRAVSGMTDSDMNFNGNTYAPSKAHFAGINVSRDVGIAILSDDTGNRFSSFLFTLSAESSSAFKDTNSNNSIPPVTSVTATAFLRLLSSAITSAPRLSGNA